MIDNWRASDPEEASGLICECCGEEFYDDEYGTKFCSEDCIVDYYGLIGTNHEEYCVYCDESLPLYEGFIEDRDGSKFCDLDCFLKFIGEK